MDGKEIYFGNLHSHTQYSDGEGTPEEAFSWARDTVQFDFYAVTDHAEQLNSSEWADAGVQADIFNEDHIFVALRGFEWSHYFFTLFANEILINILYGSNGAMLPMSIK